MNTRLLASIAMLVLLAGIISAPITQYAHADEKTKKKDVKKDVKKKDSNKKAAKTTKQSTTKTKSTSTKTASLAIEMAEGAGTNTKCNNKCYAPNNIKVALGNTVTWNNVDSAAHTATASDGSFDSGLLVSGKTFSHKFSTAGTFDYACTVHPWMKGTVTVR